VWQLLRRMEGVEAGIGAEAKGFCLVDGGDKDHIHYVPLFAGPGTRYERGGRESIAVE
jgi:hypothetical protein